MFMLLDFGGSLKNVMDYIVKIIAHVFVFLESDFANSISSKVSNNLYFPPNAEHSIETEQLNCKKAFVNIYEF